MLSFAEAASKIKAENTPNTATTDVMTSITINRLPVFTVYCKTGIDNNDNNLTRTLTTTTTTTPTKTTDTTTAMKQMNSAN